jgi:RNA polymerase sigma-70 factor (ECF subfamily)
MDGKIFDQAQQGDHLVAILFHEIRAIARQHLARERSDHTLSATALVNELYLKLAHTGRSFPHRQEFIAVASRIMRHILVDYARGHNAIKRGSGQMIALADLQFDLVAASFCASMNWTKR